MMAVAMATGALITLVACGGDADVSDQDAADAEAEGGEDTGQRRREGQGDPAEADPAQGDSAEGVGAAQVGGEGGVGARRAGKDTEGLGDSLRLPRAPLPPRRPLARPDHRVAEEGRRRHLPR